MLFKRIVKNTFNINCMKNVILIILLFATSLAFSQYNQVVFKEATFPNGMLYPIITTPGLPEVSERMNSDLQAKIADLKASDFCVGQFGYVQKADLLQIHIFCNCIEFKESQNRYYLYNIENGNEIPNMGIIKEKKKKAFSIFLNNKIKSFTVANNLVLSNEEERIIKEDLLEAFDLIFTKDGINIRFKQSSWDNKSLFISWEELTPYLEYS